MDSLDLQTWGPALLTLGFFMGIAWLPPRNYQHPAAQGARALAAILSAVLNIRYMSWRIQAMPPDQSPLQDAWAMTFLCLEMLSALSGLLILFFMSRTRNRSAEADAAQDSPLLSAPVDVFIPTYNEPQAVLERTIIGALDIDHPDLRVWVLDDGARPWVRQLAEELGVHYLFRVKGKHAKAGNINHGLAHALNMPRRPEFILILDADFIANRSLLRRTLGLFEAKNVGIVQTPHHFFNPDPVQMNLACNHVWPDEQRFFFNVLLPCKDAWGAAFCCGSSAVMRVAALDAINGIATETVTEDVLTSFKMQDRGWRTIYLNERLSLGLSPEGLAEYVMQRGRWCLGGIQQLHTRWSWFGLARIDLISRLSCLDTALYWIISFPFKLIMLANPAIYWWTGTAVIDADNADLAYWLLPSILASILFMSIYSRNLVVPIMTDITQLLCAVVVFGNVVNGLFRPYGRPFKVTPKGVSRDRVTVQWGMMWPYLVIGAALVTGMAWNAVPGSPMAGTRGYEVNVFWSLFNLTIITFVCLACIEVPQRRSEKRFNANERAVVIWPGRSGIVCRLRDISLGGARLSSDRWDVLAKTGILMLDDGRLRLPFQTLHRQQNDLVVLFENTIAMKRTLIGRLFSGRYVEELERVAVYRLLVALVNKMIG